MALNPDKSESILLGTSQRVHGYSDLVSVDVAGCLVPLVSRVKILGVTLDPSLSMDRHVDAVCKSAYYHMRSLRHFRSAISEDMAKSVASALVGSRLDYANSVLHGVTQRNIRRLQRVQNSLARIVLRTSIAHPPIFLLSHLHWLLSNTG